jgi:hypothetical protein
MRLKYYPYVSDVPNKNFYVITNNNRRLYFGDPRYEHFTEGHLNETRRRAYMNRHKKNENWNNIDSAGFWSYHYLWQFPTYKEAYENIKKIFKLI